MGTRRNVLLLASGALAVLLASGVAFLAALASAPAASAASRDNGASFAVRCGFSHRNSDDPVVHPGKQGAAHSHDFFGNRSTKFDSTYRSMLAEPTSCTRPEDTAGYWIPTVKWNGDDLQAHRAVFYYRAGGKDHTRVKAFVANLRVINASRISWYCGSEDGKVGSATPPTQCGSGVLGLRIIFQDCVARNPNTGGQRLDSADHKSHMARSVRQSDGTKRCPSTHPIPVPTLTMNANFRIPTTSGQVTLSSGAASTIHADFWNTWDQDAPLNLTSPDGRSFGGLNALVKHCINGVPPTSPRPTECRAPPTARG
jgi:hypothetical protein